MLRNRVRSIILSLILVVVIISPQCIGASSIDNSQRYDRIQSDDAIVLQVEYGNKDSNVAIDRWCNAGDGAGPEDFWVENPSSIYILDSVNNRIQHFMNGKYNSSFELEGTYVAKCFTIQMDTLYVYGFYNGNAKLYIYRNGYVYDYDLNEMKNIEAKSIIVNENNIEISDWYETFSYNYQDCELIYCGVNEKRTTKSSINTYTKEITRINETRYELQTTLMNSEYLSGEIKYVVYTDNKVVGSARIPLEKYICRPNKYVQVLDETHFYLMIPNDKALEIKVVKIEPETNLEHMICEYEKNRIDNMINPNLSQKTTTINLLLSRPEVLDRANRMASYNWYLTLSNTNTGTNITLPDFVARALNEGQLQNGASVRVTGIPYCWGGFDSQYTTNSSYSSFQNAINHGLTAGNISSLSNGKVAGTTGLDCSGFVSAAYGLSSKYGTSDFASFGRSITQESIKTMDFLVRRNNETYSSNHVLLFYNWVRPDKSKMLIIESNNPSDYDDKTLVRVVDTDQYINRGYFMRSPWQEGE